MISNHIETALRELYSERARVEAAIANLEALLSSLGGTLPAHTMTPVVSFAPVASSMVPARRRRNTAGWTSEKRVAAAERMREYWAGRRETVQREEPSDNATSSGATLVGNAGKPNYSGMFIRKKRSTDGWTDEKRQAASERMKGYWGSGSGLPDSTSSAEDVVHQEGSEA